MTGRRRRGLLCAAAVASLAGCRGDPAAVGGSGDAAADVASPPRCRATPGTSASPVSIAEVVTLVNSLPRPVTLSCFLQSLDRPLYAAAAISQISLQPSSGARSPRIFLFSGPLTMSVAPEGKGSHLVEFGQTVGELESLKGELHFPIESDVPPAEPFDKVRDGTGTTCRVCHGDESRFESIDYTEAYASIAFRPVARNRVDLNSLLNERLVCDAALEPERCAVLSALFDHGPVVSRDFPVTFAVFGN